MKNRYDFMMIFDVTNANPNGDPDAGNLPRIDPETSFGITTDVCLKRKIRNYIQYKCGDDSQTHRIYFKDGVVLNVQNKEAYAAQSLKSESKKLPKDAEKARKLTEFMCDHFYDIRTFGAVMTTEVNCGQVRGPVQISFAKSVEPISIGEHAITRSSVTKEEDIVKERTMGRKYTVPYGLYVAYGYVNPRLAAQTHFTDEGKDNDLDLLFEAIEHAFDFDASAARPANSMIMRKLIVFKHECELGNAPSHKLFEHVKITRKDPANGVARKFEDYVITIDETMPAGVTFIDKIK